MKKRRSPLLRKEYFVSHNIYFTINGGECQHKSPNIYTVVIINKKSKEKIKNMFTFHKFNAIIKVKRGEASSLSERKRL